MEALTVLIIPIACICIFKALQQRSRDAADNLAKTVFLYEALILLMANLLSIGSHLNRVSVFLFWSVCALAAQGLNIFYRKRKRAQAPEAGMQTDAKDQEKLLQKIKSLSWTEKSMLILAGLLVLVLFLGALFTVPYNYDSMTYHLARIGYWLDHGNVNYYVTNVDRQLFSPVLAEYNLLAIMALTGNDMLLNLQQFIFMLLTAYYLYRVTRMLGTGRAFSIFAAFAYLTMPLTITQAVTTQNDLSAGLFFVLFLYELLWFIQKDRLDSSLFPADKENRLLEKSVCIGACVGFAYLMKVSVCASMVMFMPWLLVVCFRRRDRITSLLQAAAAAGAALLAVILETLIRTYAACGSFIAETTSGDIMVATKNVSYIIVNILKNYSLLITQHFWTALNGFVYRIAIRVGALLHVEVNNIAISYHGFDFITYLNTGDDMYSHDRTSSAFVSYLALAAGVMLVIALVRHFAMLWRRRQGGARGPFAGRRLSYGFVISAWLGFGFIMALLRWQPWGSRLMYPALTVTVAASAHIADVFCERLKRKGIVLAPLIMLSVLLCLRPLAYNMQEACDYLADGCRDRTQHYFVHNDRRSAYAQLIEKCREIGAEDIAVVISGDGYDYPLWKMFHDSYPEASLRHILVDDEKMTAVETTLRGVHTPGIDAQGRLQAQESAPDCILWVERGLLEEGETLDYFGVPYVCCFVADSDKAPDALLVRQSPSVDNSDISSSLVLAINTLSYRLQSVEK